MAQSEKPIMQQAYEYAETCYTRSAGVARCLLQALETVPETNTALRQSITQMIERTDQLTATCETLLHDVFDLHQQYLVSVPPRSS